MKLFDIRDRIAAQPAPPHPVRVNGVEIARSAILREIQNYPAATAGTAREQAARALAVRELLLQEACRLGLVAAPEIDEEGRRETDEDAIIRQLIESEIALPQPQEAECRRFYDANIDRFRSADICEVAHILFAARRDDPEAYAAAKRRAAAAILELALFPERFAEMAEALSACPSARNGGSLGQITRGQTTAEFEAALSTMTPNSLCPDPVETRYGIHVVRMDRKIAGETLPFGLVKMRIAGYLADRVFRHAVRQYVGILARRAVIEGVTLGGGSTSVLVQ